MEICAQPRHHSEVEVALQSRVIAHGHPRPKMPRACLLPVPGHVQGIEAPAVLYPEQKPRPAGAAAELEAIANTEVRIFLVMFDCHVLHLLAIGGQQLSLRSILPLAVQERPVLSVTNL